MLKVFGVTRISLIRQTFFHQMLKNSQFVKLPQSPPNFPTMCTLQLVGLHVIQSNPAQVNF